MYIYIYIYAFNLFFFFTEFCFPDISLWIIFYLQIDLSGFCHAIKIIE